MRADDTVLALRVVSGGQSGVDRAALDAAMDCGLATGGWCPKGRCAEDGRIPDRYLLREIDSQDYALRTHWNVRDSDATLILVQDVLDPGSQLTQQLAETFKKPWVLARLVQSPDCQSVIDWLQSNAVCTLNVAGPRESNARGIHAQSHAWLSELFTIWKANPR